MSCSGTRYDVVAAVDRGDHAVDAVLRFDPDLALFDIAMPGMSGLQSRGQA